MVIVAAEGARAAAGGQLGLDPALGPPGSLRLGETIWGIDPSTLRMSVGIVLPESPARAVVQTCSLAPGALHVRQFKAREVLPVFVDRLVMRHGEPAAVAIEKPFAHGHRVPVESYYAIAAMLDALGEVMPSTALWWLEPQTWKSAALGKGNGRAKKPQIMAWAREVCGYEGELEDEADALGIATAAAIRFCREGG